MRNIRVAKCYSPSSNGNATPYYRLSLTRRVRHTMRVTEDEAKELHSILNGFFGEKFPVTFWQWLKHRFGKR